MSTVRANRTGKGKGPTVWGERIRARREELHMTQDGLAAMIGFSTNRNISNYEKGERNPDSGLLCKIADALLCTTDYLLGREDNPTHEAASVAEQTGLPASMIADLQEGKKEIDFLEARERAGLPTDYPFEFEPGDPDFLKKAHEIAVPCGQGRDARERIAFLYALWEHSDITELARRFFEWEAATVELSKKEQFIDGYDELLDNADLKRYRIIRYIEQFLHDYECDKTGRDEYEEDW